MDKNNDIQVNKVSKWREGVADEGLWQAKKSVDAFLCGYSPMLSIEALDAVRTIYVYLDEALDHFNELEARHQKDTGMISEYEEENKNLKSELDIKADKCDALISRVFKQDEEYTNLETENEKLRSQCESKDNALRKMIKEVAELEKEKIDLEEKLKESEKSSMMEIVNLKDRCNELTYRNAKYAWAIKTILKKATFSPGHVAEELRFMARKSTTPKDVQERWEEYADELLGEHSKLVDEIHRLTKKNEGLKKENDNLKQTLLNILEKLEMKVGLCRIHLLDSYEDRANLIIVEHDKLLIKYEKLKEENNDLTTDIKRLSDAVEAWFNMFNDMRHKRDFLKKENEKLKETNKSLSCPVACECENFKPKVHHSYDPLDDLPDMEHS